MNRNMNRNIYPNGYMLGENLGHMHKYVYIAHNNAHKYACFKVGHCNSPSSRMASLSGSHPEPFILDFKILTNDAAKKEKMTRDLLEKYKIKPVRSSSTEYLKAPFWLIKKVLTIVNEKWYIGDLSTETYTARKNRLQQYIPKLQKYQYFKDVPRKNKEKFGNTLRTYALHPKYGPLMFEKTKKRQAVEQHGVYRGKKYWGKKLPWQKTFRESKNFRVKPYTLKRPLQYKN